jgi:hypothetical protein
VGVLAPQKVKRMLGTSESECVVSRESVGSGECVGSGEGVVAASVRSSFPAQEEQTSTTATKTATNGMPLNAALIGASGRARARRGSLSDT